MFTNMPGKRYSRISALVLLLFSPLLLAQNSKTFGDYEVHYTVLNSTFIDPDIASRYGIVRGADRALINIAVRKQLPKGESTAQAVEISGSSSDLIHLLPLEFKEHREGDTIYYIAELKIRDKEMRSFNIKIKPDSNIAAYTLKFSKTLYIEE